MRKDLSFTMVFMSYEDFEELYRETRGIATGLEIGCDQKPTINGLKIFRSHDLKKGEWYFI
jgi:hypothetical protein